MPAVRQISDVACVVGERPCLEPDGSDWGDIEEAQIIFRGVCAACRIPASAARGADESAGLSRPVERGVGSCDRRDPGDHLRRSRHDPLGRGVDVEVQVLTGGDEHVGFAVPAGAVHPVEHVQALGVVGEHLRRDVDRIARP